MTAPLTEDGRAMRKCDGGWCDPDCSECSGLGYICDDPGFYEACDECFIGDEDVLTARDHCPPMGDAR